MLDQIEKIPDVSIFRNQDLTKFSTLKLSAVGDLIIVKSKDSLIEVQKIFKENNIFPIVIGMGANQILKEKSDVPYLKLDFLSSSDLFKDIQQEYEISASVRLSVLSSHAIKFGLKGWEVLTGIPATVGGAIFMNAGTRLGEISSILKSVTYVTKDGEVKEHIVDDHSFSYRKNNFLAPGDVILSGIFFHQGQDPKISSIIREYLEMRNQSQPLKEKTCGCVFKNFEFNKMTCRAGSFIDIIGLKGLEINGIKVSPKHANFMENRGKGSYSDMREMIELVQDELKLQYGIDFETEVKY